jgi:acyl-[acyl-carrier-protein]-phospholipid O-acyltransferase/long-chain-fatty-acid--[acyl-carrier-protein] ligase
MLIKVVKILLRSLLRLLYRAEVSGLENYYKAGKRVLIIANHTSLLDGVLLYAWLPETPTFAINTEIAERRSYKPLLKFVDLFIMNTRSPLSIKAMIKFLREDRKAVIFPEGRITVTGSLMKIYEGPGLVADKAEAMLLPIAIDGAQFSPFSYMQGIGRIVTFPKIRMIILPPVRIALPTDITGHERRKAAALQLQDIMFRLAYTVVNQRTSLYATLIHAARRHGKNTIVLEDIRRQPLTYQQILTRTVVLGRKFRQCTHRHEYTGVLMPNSSDTLIAFMALQYCGRTPAMLNYTTGLQALLQACTIGRINTILTSRQFVDKAKLHELAAGLAQQVTLLYLEDIVPGITILDKLAAWTCTLFIQRHYHKVSGTIDPDQPALLLFTSGSEGAPKGVVLSHRNLLANFAQVSCHINYGERDIILSCLPLFHSFGLNAGCLMPLFSGCRIFLYPTPLHYRLVPEMVYELGATILFGANTFFRGYARYANTYDFHTLRYAVAGAEKLTEDTQKLWMEKFGIRILQGYGVTEASPVISVNTPLVGKMGTVGRLMTGIECYLEPAEGIERGGRLVVKGPNIMLGYLHNGRDELITPATGRGPGWHDTGDIADIDHEGFITILGREKRFAKIGGEMVSLTAVEELALNAWPRFNHAALNLPDEKKGEKIILYTTHRHATRRELQEFARQHGIGEFHIPRQVIYLHKLPLLSTGKADYRALSEMAKMELTSEDH